MSDDLDSGNFNKESVMPRGLTVLLTLAVSM
jgi:hypothetical protein